MSEKKVKVYVPSTFGRVTTFQDGSEIWSIDFTKADELIKFINDNKKSDGSFRIQASKQRNDATKLSISVNDYEPKPKAVDVTNEEDSGGDLPF